MKGAKLAANCAGPLTVAGDNLFLDLGGKTVFCTTNSPWIGIDVSNRKGVRIENGNVTDCVRGINISGGEGHTIKRINIRRLVKYAPDAIYFGIFAQSSAKNYFEAVVSEGNDVGMDLTEGSYENSMKGMKLNRNTLDGLQFDFDATDNEIKDSEINENGRFGVYYGERAARNVLYHNQINKNGWVGANPDSANVLQRNVLKQNGWTTNPAAWMRGGIILFGTNNIVLENESAENNGDGISAGLPYNEIAVSNGIWKNKTGKNKGLDLADYPSGLCTQNDWSENTGVMEFDTCERLGGDPPNIHVMGSGKTGALTFEFNAQRKTGGPASGKAKLTNIPDALGNPTTARVEGRITCLAVNPLQPTSATLGLIIDKSSQPEKVVPYSTLHIFVADGAAIGPDGAPVDLVSTSNANQYDPGDCPIPSPAEAAAAPILKGKVVIVVK